MAPSSSTKHQRSTAPADATADQTTTNTATQAAQAQTTPAKAPKTKTPEQQAAGMRREAGELRRAAKTLGEDSEGGKSLLLRATGLEIDADALAPRKNKSTENRPTCSGTKKDGSPCTAHAMADSDFCTDHRPVRARFTDDEWAAFQAIPTDQLIARLGWGVALKMAKDALGSK